MRYPRNEGAIRSLELRRDGSTDPRLLASYATLVEEVFGVSPARSDRRDPAWRVLASFQADGACVAGLEIGDLPLVLDGADGAASAIRLAGVAESHRGLGLFRTLLLDALAICEGRGDAVPTLLYAETADLYARFGFVPLAQHAFAGAPPQAMPSPPARHLDRAAAADLIDRIGYDRATVSRQCAVRGAVDLLRSNLDDEDLRFAVLDAPGAGESLVVYESEGDELVIVDIVARAIPSMGDIVGALGSGARRVRTLFPPDRLGWEGAPTRDETGLMIRGRLPAAMRRPFMLPPTTSF